MNNYDYDINGLEQKLRAAERAGLTSVQVDTGIIGKLLADRKGLKNELCLQCGRFVEEHLGSCDGCRWKEI